VQEPLFKIAVVTLHHGDLPHFPYSARINRTYCERHGYEWVVAAPSDPPRDRHLNWSKVRCTADLLARRQHAYVLFVDADAWFYDQAQTLEQLITSHMPPGTLMMFGTDRRDKDFAWSDKDANAGVFIVRNTPLARHVMEEWWHVAVYDKRTCNDWPLEQRAFNWHIRPRWQAEGRIRVIPYHHLNGRDGTFIRHAVGESQEARVSILRDECERICGGGQCSTS
jgi:hypothetical protein